MLQIRRFLSRRKGFNKTFDCGIYYLVFNIFKYNSKKKSFTSRINDSGQKMLIYVCDRFYANII